MRYTKPAILSTLTAASSIQMTGQHKVGIVPDGAHSSAAGYGADE
jgi:hypothetical protein